MRMKLLVSVTVTAVVFSCAAKADIEMNVHERVAHCKSLANLAFLAAKKVKTGREFKEIKKELSNILQAGLTSTNGGIYADLFLLDYNQLLQDTYSKKPKFEKEYALNYRSECIGKEKQQD